MANRKVCIVGVGKIAVDQHVPAIDASPDWELAATVSRKGSVEGIPTFRDFDVLLSERPDIEVISLCLPPQPRFQYARKALKAGRHVMLEKPPGQTLSEVHDLQRLAEEAGVTLFATWHSRMGKGVAGAKAFLAGKEVTGGKITWKEDVRHWHPGQEWVFEPGGLGVFDPGINALSILTEILPKPVHVTRAELDFPDGRQTPIAARVEFSRGVTMELDWLQTGPQTWDMEIHTTEGSAVLKFGGNELWIDGQQQPAAEIEEYPALYARMADLVENGRSDVDLSPLTHVADAMTLGRRNVVAPFAF
ncbi:Gfo/Idh/MocA family oxidoreductase [Rubellimicrobium rubrum]|uniref:Gfo/Idh/MocA family oxidoreductase n=1 Tax=Rubellimicrobium rubrum TaxID=2585369 RepID=A0A5C4MXR7_9RHOB|nr:Gfo/Idh/MocA family oxidoreductase [Rubellimicrobium rubrum]TNC49863.1 Gfo/Idh/MocA family oxidoreductase [Rubellimicrobium rubrum]